MNVALATTTAVKPLPIMTARGGATAERGADTGLAPAADPAANPAPVAATDPAANTTASPTADKDAPIVGRYPKVAYRYDADASRLVLLFRNPADGATVDQIPTETALKQYKEALKDRKSGAPSLKLLVGGSDEQGQQGVDDPTARNGAQNGSTPNATSNSGSAKSGSSTPGKAGSSSHTTSASAPTVVHSSPVSTHVASTAKGGTARVNMVI
ncbi:hypothetical protein [Azospirillum sp. sgz302134]